MKLQIDFSKYTNPTPIYLFYSKMC